MFKDRLFYRRAKFLVLLLVIALLAVVLVSPVRAQDPEVQISVTTNQMEIQPGGTLTYTIQFTNTGQVAAEKRPWGTSRMNRLAGLGGQRHRLGPG